MYAVESLEEKKHGMDILLKQLEDNPDKITQESLSNDKYYKNLGILRLDVAEINGKWGDRCFQPLSAPNKISDDGSASLDPLYVPLVFCLIVGK